MVAKQMSELKFSKLKQCSLLSTGEQLLRQKVNQNEAAVDQFEAAIDDLPEILQRVPFGCRCCLCMVQMTHYFPKSGRLKQLALEPIKDYSSSQI